MKKFITTLFVGFLGLVLLNSCSEDNEEPMSVKTAHIGAWNTSMESSNWKSINIESNGTMKYGYLSAEELEEKGYVYDAEEGIYKQIDGMYLVTYNPKSNAYWAFDEASQTISMYTEDGYYAFTYKVVMNEGFNSWAGVDLVNGRTYSFVRK